MRTAWTIVGLLVVAGLFAAVPAEAAKKYAVVEHEVLFIACGMGMPLVNGDGSVWCGNSDANQRTSTLWNAADELNTMVVEAQWSGLCWLCMDGRAWLQFRLQLPRGMVFDVWSDPPFTTARRHEFNLTEEEQGFVVGNWTLRVQPAPGNPSQLYQGNGGLTFQVRVDVYVTMAHGGYELPPDYTAIPG